MIEVANLTVWAGNFCLKEASFTVPQGNYAVLMGRTGSGKTTLLEAICGLRTIQAGTIRLGGVDVSFAPPAERGIGYVPQDLALFPTMTVKEHLEFALKIRRQPRTLINERTNELARLLGIEHLLSRRPLGLSGGEAQRVALGRALSFRPTVLLFDEPLSALDETTRDEMYTLLRNIRQQTEMTVLHITHSRQEAQTLADCLFELHDGQINPRSL